MGQIQSAINTTIGSTAKAAATKKAVSKLPEPSKQDIGSELGKTIEDIAKLKLKTGQNMKAIDALKGDETYRMYKSVNPAYQKPETMKVVNEYIKAQEAAMGVYKKANVGLKYQIQALKAREKMLRSKLKGAK